MSYNEDGVVETVSYSQLITPMLKAMQEQQEEIVELRQTVRELKSLVEEMRK